MREAAGRMDGLAARTRRRRARGIDTRSLVLHLRDRGAMRAAASGTAVDEVLAEVGAAVDGGRALVAGVSPREPYTFAGEGTSGSRSSTTASSARSCALCGAGAAVDVYPHDVDADTLAGYDGVLLATARATRRRSSTRRAPCAICSAAPGARRLPRPPVARARHGHETFKLPFGHRGANHPVVDHATAPRARHLPEPRLRGRSGDGEAYAHVAVRRHRRGLHYPELRARSASSTPRRARARTTARRSSRSGSRSSGLPRRDDLESICLIGSGPIVIGQACEFDYAAARR
jgi:hypothetical protein